MQTLLPTLLDHDPGLLDIIAHRWDVHIQGLDKRAAAEALADAMLDPDRAAREWSRLNDAERGALQTLLGAPDHRMAEVQFSRLFGAIRQMGPGRRDREKPHLNPASVTEVLYFRGLIAVAYDQGKAGMQPFVYVPPDLAAVFPIRETSVVIEAKAGPPANVQSQDQPDDTHPATTGLVDDLTTLLAYLQVHRIPAETDTLQREVSQGLAPYWLRDHSPASIALMIALLGSLGLATSDEGVFRLASTPVRRWLEESRPRQVRALAEAWRNSTLYNELWQMPDLQPEETGWRNDILLARQTVLTYVEMVPPLEWWPLDELITLVKTEEPDFQRPAGDYTSWYIRDPQTGQYLHGFENWDRVDGALLRFLFTGPMHWLGLVDLGNGGTLCRLTAYGRALCGEGDWPDPPEERVPLAIEPDGTVFAPRTASRYERFQAARVTDWVSAGDPFVYRLSAAGLRQAAEQGIQTDAIQAFLRRASGGNLPDAVNQLLARWEQAGSAEVWLSRAFILRTQSPEALQTILDTPELRRYLGAVLGPSAVIVRDGQEDDLAAALQQRGILVELHDR